MRIRVRLVPNVSPNAQSIVAEYAVTEPEWMAAMMWMAHDRFIAWLVPDDMHAVSVETI